MTLPWIAALLGVLLAATSRPQQPNETADLCMRYVRIEVPAADLPTAADRQRLMGCDSERLYFGFDKPARVVDARKCAQLQWDAVTVDKGTFFAATGILMMIYANGRGATRNLDLALKFSCEFDGSHAEMSGRIERLQRLKTRRRTGRDFHICDVATSSAMMGTCARFEEEFRRIARQRQFDTVMSAWRPDEKNAWRALLKTTDEFFAAIGDHEVDVSGAMRGIFRVEAVAALADGLLKALEAFEHGTLPRSTPDEFRRADAELNARYQQLQTREFRFGSVDTDGIKTAQRVWQRYREAWVRFGTIKYPDVTADGWRTWLTRERIAMWKDFDPQ